MTHRVSISPRIVSCDCHLMTFLLFLISPSCLPDTTSQLIICRGQLSHLVVVFTDSCSCFQASVVGTCDYSWLYYDWSIELYHSPMLFSLDTILRCLWNVPFCSILQHPTGGPKPALNLTHRPSLYVYKLAQYNGQSLRLSTL